MVIGWFTTWILSGIPLVLGVAIWALVEFIMILVGASPFDRNAAGLPLQK